MSRKEDGGSSGCISNYTLISWLGTGFTCSPNCRFQDLPWSTRMPIILPEISAKVANRELGKTQFTSSFKKYILFQTSERYNCCSNDDQSHTKGKELLVIGAFSISIIAKQKAPHSASGHSKVQAPSWTPFRYCIITIIVYAEIFSVEIFVGPLNHENLTPQNNYRLLLRNCHESSSDLLCKPAFLQQHLPICRFKLGIYANIVFFFWAQQPSFHWANYQGGKIFVAANFRWWLQAQKFNPMEIYFNISFAKISCEYGIAY